MPTEAVILVCEMAGNTTLLVPLMLSVGIAFVALCRVSLYPAQVPSVHESPVHRPVDPLLRLRCRDVLPAARPFICVDSSLSIPQLTNLIGGAADQDVFPVVAANRGLLGVISAESLRVLGVNFELQGVAIAADLMGPLVAVRLDDDLRTVSQLLVAMDLPADIVAMLDEHDISVAVLGELPGRRT